MVNVTVKPSPFGEKYQIGFPDGVTIADIVRDAPDLVTRDHSRLLVRVNGEPANGVDPHWFPYVRPHSALNDVVTVQPREGLGGGDVERGKSVLGGGVGLFGIFGGPVGAIFGPIAEIIGGTVLENLRGPSRRGANAGPGSGSSKFNTAGISINPIKIGEPLPAVFGTMKVSPPPIAPSWTEQRDKDIFATFLGGVEGEGEWSDVRVNGIPIGDIEGSITANTEGADGDTNIQFEGADLPTVVEEQLNIELPLWDVVTSGGTAFTELVDQSDPTTSRPNKPTAKARSGANQIWLNFVVPSGAQVIPGQADVGFGLRISMRKRGDTTWRFLPYIHMFSVGNPNPFRFHIRLIFAADPGGLSITGAEPFESAYQEWRAGASGLADDGGNETHTADGFFNSAGATGLFDVVSNAVGQETDHIRIYLDPDDANDPFDIDEWEVRVDPGSPQSPKRTSSNTHYHITRDVGGIMKIPGDGPAKQNEVLFKVLWQSISSYFDEYPVSAPNVAQLFVRVPNVQMNEITAVFKRKLKTWNGVQWTGSTITSSPAAAIRQVWTDPQSAEPFPDGYLNDQELGDFYDHCVTQGLEFNAFIEDGDQHTWPIKIAKLAKAKVKLGATRGIWWDKDRSANAPVATMSGHNGAGFKLSNPRDQVPHGYKVVNFFNSADEYRETARTVYRTGFSASNATDIRHFDAEGLVTTAQVDDIVGYLLDEFAERNSLISATLSVEGRLIDRGDLIAVQSDALNSLHGDARIVSIQESGPNVTGLTLTNNLPLTNIAADIFGLANIFSPTDIFAPGNSAGVLIMLSAPSPQVITKEINETADTNVITFVTPFATPSNLKVGLIVMAGPFGTETERMYVLEKSGGQDQTVNVLCMPEANALVT